MLSEDAHVIMPYHRRVDVARERLKGEKKIGTTGRGIGPSYEDKVGREGIRIGDLLDPETFWEKLHANLALKNQCLETCLHDEGLKMEEIFQEYSGYAERLGKYVGNTSVFIDREMRKGKNLLFEGAQGTHLDVDHGTYPFVTSSNTTAGGACTGAGVGPTKISEVIGVSKAYTTRVGAGPFPTELKNEIGERIRQLGRGIRGDHRQTAPDRLAGHSYSSRRHPVERDHGDCSDQDGCAERVCDDPRLHRVSSSGPDSGGCALPAENSGRVRPGLRRTSRVGDRPEPRAEI